MNLTFCSLQVRDHYLPWFSLFNVNTNTPTFIIVAHHAYRSVVGCALRTPQFSNYPHLIPKQHYTDRQSQNGAPENSVSLLDLHREWSLRLSLMWMLRVSREIGVELALGPEE